MSVLRLVGGRQFLEKVFLSRLLRYISRCREAVTLLFMIFTKLKYFCAFLYCWWTPYSSKYRPVSPPAMGYTRANLLLLYCRFMPLDSCWHISHQQRSVSDWPVSLQHTIPSTTATWKANIKGLPKRYRIFERYGIHYLWAHPVHTSLAADKLWGICVHDDAHVS